MILGRIGKPAQLAVRRAEPQPAVQHAKALCGHIGPVEPRRIAVFLGQRAVRNIDMPVDRQIVFAFKYHGAGVRKIVLGGKPGHDRIGHRADGALLGDCGAEHTLHPARGQKQRQVIQGGEGARCNGAFALRALLERIECRAVVCHQVGAQIAGCLLCTARLDDQLALILLEVADDRRRIRSHAGIAQIGEIGRVVQTALPVAIGLVRVAGEEHARVVLAAIQAGNAALVDFIRVSIHSFGKTDRYVGQTIAVGRGGGQRHQTGRAVDRRDRDRLAVHLCGDRGVVQILGIHLELGR